MFIYLVFSFISIQHFERGSQKSGTYQQLLLISLAFVFKLHIHLLSKTLPILLLSCSCTQPFVFRWNGLD